MDNSIDLPVKYIIVALTDKGREYYSIDLQSGGYPYWSSFLSGAKTFDFLDDTTSAWKEATRQNGGYMNTRSVDITLCEVQTALVPIRTYIGPSKEETIEMARKTALAKLTNEEKKLLGLD
jgi:hypothetical protein